VDELISSPFWHGTRGEEETKSPDAKWQVGPRAETMTYGELQAEVKDAGSTVTSNVFSGTQIL